MRSLHNEFCKRISCLVVPHITDNMPSRKLGVSKLDIPKHLRLADPNYALLGQIDVLLGADVFYQKILGYRRATKQFETFAHE